MVTRTITATVAEDGTIHLPDGAARPGDSVIVQIEQAEGDTEQLTLATAVTPEQRDALIARWRSIGQVNRALLSDEERTLDHGEWLYGEDGLPR